MNRTGVFKNEARMGWKTPGDVAMEAEEDASSESSEPDTLASDSEYDSNSDEWEESEEEDDNSDVLSEAAFHGRSYWVDIFGNRDYDVDAYTFYRHQYPSREADDEADVDENHEEIAGEVDGSL
ncbi:hypothetical protein OEA41_008638 [Lepraria neglecta]|uniref:Uncharacterized protein n=1 Tax=Lepraria neglecta TaxID=209136 RepID=A0AAE0DHC2_9LECA|nr:hypothetical protein OEA41_008638 [Lepraria neglecta]